MAPPDSALDTVVLDLGNVVLTWDPLPAIAAGVGEAEARRFLDAFDFGAWNHHQDAGRTFAEADAWTAAHAPEWLPHTRAYRAHFTASLTGAVPGVTTLVERLVGAGVATYALTNWSAETFPLARAEWAVLGLFADIVVSGEVGLAKPDPAMFTYAAQRFGTTPERLFFVDDSPRNVDGAATAGCDAVLFTDAATLEADLVARGLLA